jgi:transcriptional regulator NrdR family protein
MKKGAKYCIVKRHGHQERFDGKKVYASCYAACLSAHVPKQKAEEISAKVEREVKKLLSAKVCVSSTVIFNTIARTLAKHEKNAGFMYKTHRDIS